MCNAYNHPPGCRCGWGGGNSTSRGSYIINSYNARTFDPKRGSESSGYSSTGKPKTSPTHCPWCGEEVFYHTNGNGDSVYFDSLGSPWKIHDCYLTHQSHKESVSAKYSDNERLRNRKLQKVIKHNPCVTCGGDGVSPNSDVITCPICLGVGSIKVVTPTPFGSFSHSAVCHVCKSGGYVFEEKCQTCNGSGRQQ